MIPLPIENRPVSLLMERNLSSDNYVDPISHDGVHDSLTHLAAPLVFYEFIHREISRSIRTESDLSVVRFLLLPIQTDSKSEYEIALINFSKVLTQSSRLSDLSARVGKLEFLTLVTSDSTTALNFINRVKTLWKHPNFQVSATHIQYRHHEGLLSLMGRLHNPSSN